MRFALITAVVIPILVLWNATADAESESPSEAINRIVALAEAYDEQYQHLLDTHVVFVMSDSTEPAEANSADAKTPLHWELRLLKNGDMLMSDSLQPAATAGDSSHMSRLVLARNADYSFMIESAESDLGAKPFQVKKLQRNPLESVDWLLEKQLENLKQGSITNLPMASLSALLTNERFQLTQIRYADFRIVIEFAMGEPQENSNELWGLSSGTIILKNDQPAIEHAVLYCRYSDMPCDEMSITNQIASAEGFSVPYVQETVIQYRGIHRDGKILNGREEYRMRIDPKPTTDYLNEFQISTYGLDEPVFPESGQRQRYYWVLVFNACMLIVIGVYLYRRNRKPQQQR